MISQAVKLCMLTWLRVVKQYRRTTPLTYETRKSLLDVVYESYTLTIKKLYHKYIPYSTKLWRIWWTISNLPKFYPPNFVSSNSELLLVWLAAKISPPIFLQFQIHPSFVPPKFYAVRYCSYNFWGRHTVLCGLLGLLIM